MSTTAPERTDAGPAGPLSAQVAAPVRRFLRTEAGSAGLLRVWMPLTSQIERFIVESHPLHYPDYVEVGTRHQPIVDALRQHDSEAAVSAVQEHIMLIWSRIRS